AGLKTANLFSAGIKSKKEITIELRGLNRLLTKQGLRAVPIRTKNDRILIYAISFELCRRGNDICCGRGTNPRDVSRRSFKYRGDNVCGRFYAYDGT
nr:hypothetical protein [Lachnospiraceae bacterium]